MQTFPVQAQSGLTEHDSNRLNNLVSGRVNEMIYLHTDREDYIAGENIWFTIYLLDPRSLRLTSSSNLAYVEILNSENRPVMQKRIRLAGGSGPGEAVLPDTLSSGSYLLRAYTRAMKDFMPDGCFMKRINIYNALSAETELNPPWEEVSPAIDQAVTGDAVTRRNSAIPPSSGVRVEMIAPDSCGTRERITLEFGIRDRSSVSPIAVQMSISVAPFTGKRDHDITFLVNKTPVNEPLSGITPGKDIENEFHFIQGHLINRNTMMPDSGKYIFLSIPGKTTVFNYSRTDGEGLFRFSLPIDEVGRELIIQPEGISIDNILRIIPSFSEVFPVSFTDVDANSKPSPEYVSALKVNYQVNRIYETQTALPPLVPQLPGKPPKSFYGIPDFTLDLDDYIRLPVMQEVFYELVPGVKMREKRSGYEMLVADPYFNVIYDQPPVTFVDGVVVSDPAVIAGLDPELVERIEVIWDRYVVGDYLFFGLVNIITYDGDFSRLSLPENAVRLPYRVTDPVRRFYSPDYSTLEMKHARIPDFRNTLFWSPSVTASDDGKYRVEFWSSDVTGDYEICLQGITDNGKPVSFRQVFRVK